MVINYHVETIYFADDQYYGNASGLHYIICRNCVGLPLQLPVCI